MSAPVSFIARLRLSLSEPTTSVHLCILGIVGGVFAASLIILFRLSIQTLDSLVRPFFESPENASLARVIIPFLCVGCILFVAYMTGFKHYRLGIPFVIHRIKMHFGMIPFRTTINQFFGGMFALAGGFAVGREGPSVHLGAAGSSFLGQWLRLPYNSIRILAGCGIAAGISASFNTPLAAVIFVMEVVLREYRIHVFVPVMLSAAFGSVLARAVFGSVQELAFFSYVPINQWMYFFLIVFGIFLGALAALFNFQLMRIMRFFRPIKMAWRLLIAAAITAFAGYTLPEALGANFESVKLLFDSTPTTAIIALLLIVKMYLAISTIGLGIPGGIIGPVMTIGMLAGALVLSVLNHWVSLQDYIGGFALLGLAGMLTAVLHAPLAALTAVMELSHSPDIILPAMLVIVPAYVTSTQVFNNRSIFLQQLDYQKLAYAVDPMHEALGKIGVLAAMQENFKHFYDAPDKAIEQYLSQNPSSIVIQQLTFELASNFKLAEYDVSLDKHSSAIKYIDVEGITAQSTLAEVYEMLRKKRGGAVYVYDSNPDRIMGVITWNSVQRYLQSNVF